MKRAVSLIVMLALVAMTVVVDPGMHDSPSAAAADQNHSHMAESSIADVLSACCSVEDGKVHHTSGSCAIDCGSMLHWIPAPVVVTAAKPQFAELPDRALGVFSTQFRPPIAA